MTRLSKYYDKAKAEELIKVRYTKSIPAIRLTLKRIVPTDHFQNLKSKLRNEGWKDWHILLALDNLVLNFRMSELGIRTIHDMNNFRKKFMQEEEKEENLIVPLDQINEENMKNNLKLSMLSTLKGYGFSLEGKMIDPEEISKFLAEKFNYWKDDVDHEPVFDMY